MLSEYGGSHQESILLLLIHSSKTNDHNFKIITSTQMDPEAEVVKKNLCNHILQTCEEEQERGNLYLGSIGSLKPEIVKMYGISAILTVMDAYMYGKFKTQQRVKGLNVAQYKWLDIEDSEEEDISKHFNESYEYIQNSLKKHNVLVHCQAGVSRSATIVIYYVMKKLNVSLQLANKLVTSKRYVVSPNQGFWNQLLNQEKKLFENVAGPKESGIKDPDSLFRTQKYPQKFANHIVCLNSQGLLEKGNLFLGQFSILKSHFLKSLLITSVVSVVDEPYYKRMKIKEIIEHEKIENHLWVNVKDSPQEKLADFFDQSFNFINQHIEKGNVLVHCQAGVSRSASVVIAFLIKKFKVNFQEAFKFVQSKRKVVNPNQGFQIGLVEYSEKIISN